MQPEGGPPAFRTGRISLDGGSLEVGWWGSEPDTTPTLVLLHEGLGSVALWRDFPARLATATGCGANLRRVLSYRHQSPDVDGKELRTLSRAALRSYARYWLEVFRLPVISVERIVSGMHIDAAGEEAMFANLKAGRGVVIALPHMGNFEQAGAWVVAAGAGSFTTVVERLRPESVYEAFVRFRQSLGMEVLPLTGGQAPFGILAQRLRAGKLVCLVSDRDLKDTGVEVEMFGEKARIAATAGLALHTGAALMPVATWFEGDDWGAHIYPEIPVPDSGTRAEKIAAMSQQLARVFEIGIAEHPQDWHMLQRVFTADLDQSRLPAPQAMEKQ